MNEKLLSDLRTGTDSQRRAAAYRLGKSGAPDLVPRLIDAYNDRDPVVRRNVLESLRSIGTDDAMRFIESTEAERQQIFDHVQQTGSVPEAEQLASLPIAEPSPEAVEHFESAMEVLSGAGEDELTDALKLDVASELALAIHRANAPFPRAHALLAMLLNELGDDARAGRHASIALDQDQNEFRAQLVKLDVDLKGVRFVSLRPRHFIALDDTLEGVYFGSIAKSIRSLVVAGHAGITQTGFRSEINRLISIFKNQCKAGVEVGEYLYMADVLIDLGDFARELPFSSGYLDLYAAVANTPVDEINLSDREEEVSAVHRKAKGRSLLFRR